MKEDFSQLWNKLSDDGRWLARKLATLEKPISKKHLEVLLVGISIEKGLKELEQMGIIEATDFITEQRNTVEQFKHLAAQAFANDDHELSEGELALIEAFTKVNDYEEAPDIHRGWEEKRYTLKAQYRSAVNAQA